MPVFPATLETEIRVLQFEVSQEIKKLGDPILKNKPGMGSTYVASAMQKCKWED
jgi:hypothetical protein